MTHTPNTPEPIRPDAPATPEPLQPAADEEVLAVSARLIAQNLEAYEVLAQ